ncbi:hypothetical protein [Pseudogemmobacter sonorensis]|uniref:hypothetical protein n=1 Tax=Pseudogemmobacter sonorensis TaxID=2989681 RepID=UPI0036932A2D
MQTLTQKQVMALLAFLEAFDLTTTGAWAGIESCMRDDFGIDDPEAALAEARDALTAL